MHTLYARQAQPRSMRDELQHTLPLPQQLSR